MWSDNETTRDFVNFRHVAEIAAQLIVQAKGEPLSLGISGGWGIGKSSMVKLIAQALEKEGKQYVFVEFNAWLYQGFDDARAALLEVVGRSVFERAKQSETAIDKAKSFLSGVSWIRATRLAIGAAPLAFGLPPIGLLGDAVDVAKSLGDGVLSGADAKAAQGLLEDSKGGLSDLYRAPAKATPPKEIQLLREQFRETLDELDVTLVVLIDDLDRCLPATAISTLEAIRLLLFMPRTAFVVAADDEMIRRAVGAHFGGANLDDRLVRNYFDKLIQVPIRVPPLGTQDVRAYLSLLFIDQSDLSPVDKEPLRERICKQLGESWQGKRVDRAFVTSLRDQWPSGLMERLDLADRLAPLMTTGRDIAGNPRLIKRFLNTLWMRSSIAAAHNVPVDEAVLAKMLLLERCGDDALYRSLVQSINDSESGSPDFLGKLEARVAAAEPLGADAPSGWDDEFAKEWLALEPTLAGKDLRPVVYVSRDHVPLISAADQLSPEAAEMLAALLELKTQKSSLVSTSVGKLSKREVHLIMARLLVTARSVDSWGVPPVLHACLTVIDADASQAARLADLLKGVGSARLTAGIVPILGTTEWGTAVLREWLTRGDLSGPVKNAADLEIKGKGKS